VKPKPPVTAAKTRRNQASAAATPAAQKALAAQWKAAAAALRAARHADIRRQDNAEAIVALGELSRHVLERARPRRSPGFVEMYRILARGARTR
jgi:hypothetical protein